MFPSRLRIAAVVLLTVTAVSLVAPASALPTTVPGKPRTSIPRGPLNPNTDGRAQESKTSHRLIVELSSDSLVNWTPSGPATPAATGRPNVNSPAAQAYITQLRREQAAFVRSMNTALPGARVNTFRNERGVNEAATYQVVFNGLSIDPGRTNREQARQALLKLPNVKNVYLDYAYATTLYSSTDLINAPALWNNAEIGGRSNAGEGVKVASIDGGIHHDAPMFSGEGYDYPPDFPEGGKGLTENNNGKIIASRVYFRTWDPPAPGDENPWPGEEGTSHGVHTSGIAAGNLITDGEYSGLELPPFSGVAPKAWVMSYRVFYYSVTGDETFYTTEGIAALEDVVADGADVVNNSWGDGPYTLGGEFDALDKALQDTHEAGVFVSMSAGNSGPGGATTDHPSDDYMIAAATTSGGTLASGRTSVTAPGTPDSAALKDRPFGIAEFGRQLEQADVEQYPFKTAASVDPANATGCSAWPANTFAGRAAIIERGGCEFGVKVLNAEKAGATFAVIYNSVAGGEAVMDMGPGEVGDQVTIASIFIPRSMGLGMVEWYEEHGNASTFEVNTVAFQVGNEPDVVVGFSSRGPGVGNVLKPDIAAPGVNILSQGYTPGAEGEARHLGFGQASGTSMASPHVAGAAALLRQIHPDWSNEYIKSALMSTAKYTEVYLDDELTIPAQPLDIGAGRLDLTHAADPGAILSPPSLSYGLMDQGTTKSIAVTLTNIDDETETYRVSTLFTGDGFDSTTPLRGFTVRPASVTLQPGQTRTVNVTFNSARGQGLGDNQGYILFDGENHDLHAPAWARVIAAEDAADVLILDNDLSALDPAFGFDPTEDYLEYYTDALTELGYTYDVWDVDAHAADASVLPEPHVLFTYDTILLFTGDNYTPVMGTTDIDRLTEYANNGGFVLAMGQDLSAALGAPDTSPFFYDRVLDATWLQDSVTDFELPTLPVVSSERAPEAFDDLIINLSGSGIALTSEQEVPPVNVDNGTVGSADLSYFADERELQYTIEISPTRPITLTSAHIHAGRPGQQGPIIHTLFAGPPEYLEDEVLVIEGSVTMTPEQEEALLSGALYINAHSTANPMGEVRGQITAASVRDGADNQYYIDELAPPERDNIPDIPGDQAESISLLRYPGPHNKVDGIVALARRDQPSLENPGISYQGQAIYTAFGLEGVNNIEGTTSREELLQTFFNWANDRPTVTISQTMSVDSSNIVTFAATVTSPVTNTQGATYRWDFGDGTGIAGPFASSQSLHTYEVCGAYTVRVEVTDTYGHVSIGTLRVNVDEGCENWRMHLPLVFR